LRLIKLYTRENRRYPHPYATVNDIAGQKGGKLMKMEIITEFWLKEFQMEIHYE